MDAPCKCGDTFTFHSGRDVIVSHCTPKGQGWTVRFHDAKRIDSETETLGWKDFKAFTKPT